MKTCKGCKYADWKKTKTGRLHPDKSGTCVFPWKMPPLPASRYVFGHFSIGGGYIERGDALKDHCVYYAAQPQPEEKESE